jgi:hypothetical protein
MTTGAERLEAEAILRGVASVFAQEDGAGRRAPTVDERGAAVSGAS